MLRLPDRSADPASGPEEDAGRRNLLLLTQLRWLAVAGQLATILLVHFLLGAALPLVAMGAVLATLVLVNLATIAFLGTGRRVADYALFLALLVDVAVLSAQLYLSGGATNPFVSLYLLQVVIGAVLLEPWASWALVAVGSAVFAMLTVVHRALLIPATLAQHMADLHLVGSWFNFVVAAVLLTFFVSRIGRNLRDRDARLARMRQQAAEEDHIVRMGLLASGAAHELGTPLASLSVILGDWQRLPALADDPRLAEEIAEMQTAVGRCKEIMTGVLYASGEMRGEGPARTSLRRFLAEIAQAWEALHPGLLQVDDRLHADLRIIADKALAQILGNLLDNAAEASAQRVTLCAAREGETMLLSVRDDGVGFPPAMLETIGRPYQTSKGRRGAGLGLFLAVNVLRKLGGSVTARNLAAGGAEVTLAIPLAAMTMARDEGADDHG